MNKITPILHNIRSLHNVGAILRTCDGLGISEVWASGITPYPKLPDDKRLPHVSKRATEQISKTALGAEKNIKIKHFSDVTKMLEEVNKLKMTLVGVEQAINSTDLADFKTTGNIGLVFGNEVEGLDKELLEVCEQLVEIPMLGSKESFNVSVVAGMVLYTLTRKS